MFFKPSGRKKELSDQDLIVAYQQTKDMEYLGELYGRYVHLVFGVCLKYLKDREDCQDAVMQIFEKLVEEVLRVEIKNFGSWLHVISKNHCLMKLRSQKSAIRRMDEYSHEKIVEFQSSMHPKDEVSVEAHLDIMIKCMEKLPSDQKKCVDLFYMKEKSYREIVEIAGFELKKVKSYLQNGKRNIKICIEQHIGKRS